MTSRTLYQSLPNDRPVRGAPARNTPPIQTSTRREPPDTRFSFTDTPMEMLRQPNQSAMSPTHSTIEESPTSATSPSRMLPSYSASGDSHSPVPAEKAHLLQSPDDIHPAFFAPYTDEHQSTRYATSDTPTPSYAQVHSPREPQQRQMSSGQKQSDGSHTVDQGPITLTSPGGSRSTPVVPNIQSPVSSTSYKPSIEPDHSFAAPPLHAIKTDPAVHRPGQISHPNSESSEEWIHGLCDVSPVCCTALFCPCLVYGKTMYRLSRKTAKQDPTDLLGYENCNGACGLMALACGFQWTLAWIQRMRIRKVYRIEGGAGEDCIKSFCCCCCVLAQDEREMRDREESRRHHQGPGAGSAYIAPGGMAYAPPPK